MTLTETVMRAHSERTWGHWDPDFHRDLFHEALSRLTSSIVLCTGAQAGYLALDETGRALYVQSLFLLPSYQNRGIGAAILADLIDVARAARKPLRLRVLPVNAAARRFYERLGLRVVDDSGEFLLMEHPAGAATTA